MGIYFMRDISQKSIGMQNESSLHDSIKKWYYKEGDKFEQKVNNYIIDIVRNDLLIEVQTGNFPAIKKKLSILLATHKVRLIYPIAVEKWIVKIKGSKIISRRKSPKTGNIYEVFKELMYIREAANNPNFSLEILLIAEEQIRTDDGKGSWRRKGVSITDRKLIDVKESIKFENKNDYRIFIPEKLKKPYSNKTYSKFLNISIYNARKINYTLCRMNVISVTAKSRNELLYDFC